MNLGGHTCTITSVDGCLLISGSVDVTLLNALIPTLPKRSVFNFDVQRLGGYSFALGLAAPLAAIAKRLGDAEMRALAASDPRLSEGARRWLSYGAVGASSAAMFWGCTDHTPRGVNIDRDNPAWPRDPEDLLRCLRLVETVPECANAPDSMRGKSAVWDRLADAWPALVEAIDAEIPKWREGKSGSAPKTYEMMKKATEGAP